MAAICPIIADSIALSWILNTLINDSNTFLTGYLQLVNVDFVIIALIPRSKKD
jgi:hypothetical protein